MEELSRRLFLPLTAYVSLYFLYWKIGVMAFDPADSIGFGFPYGRYLSSLKRSSHLVMTKIVMPIRFNNTAACSGSTDSDDIQTSTRQQTRNVVATVRQILDSDSEAKDSRAAWMLMAIPLNQLSKNP